MEDLPPEVVHLNDLLDQSYQLLLALFTDATIYIEGQAPMLPGDPRRNEVVVDVSQYLIQYAQVSNTFQLPQWMMDKHMFLLTLIRWILDPNDDLFVELEYDSEDFGEDVEKTGYTAEEIQQYTLKRPLNKLRLPIQQATCTICLEEFGATEEVTRLNCLHIYHDPCLQGWLKHNKTCPLCVADISQKRVKKRVVHAPKEQLEVRRRCSKRLRGLSPDDEIIN